MPRLMSTSSMWVTSIAAPYLKNLLYEMLCEAVNG